MKKVTRRLALALLTLFGLVLAAGAAGLRFNTTGSYPVGLYYKTNEAPEIGDLVYFCPPDKAVFREALQRGYLDVGNCPGGQGHLIKKILAAKGDTISITRRGVLINGQYVPHSLPIREDKAGRLLPQLNIQELTLANDQVLMMSDYSPKSFDGRYFGPIARPQDAITLKPIIIETGM